MLQRHYHLLSKMSVDSVFDASCKEEVEDSVNVYSSLSEESTDALLDKEKKFGEIAKCLKKLKNAVDVNKCLQNHSQNFISVLVPIDKQT